MGNHLEATDDQGNNQDQFSISNGTSHRYSPFTEEFSELLSLLSTKTMLSLMSTQQKNLADALWTAENFGGKPLPGQLKEVYPKREYYELVLMMEHQRQWEEKQRYCQTAKNC
jgi:hypothetical protein